MPYISTEDVTKKRKAIKAAFPTWKFSITREHYTSLNVSILEADLLLTDKPNESVNHFYIQDHYVNSEIQTALQTIADIMTAGTKIVSEDIDYGSIPNFYTNLSIGKWNKPFIYKPKV